MFVNSYCQLIKMVNITLNICWQTFLVAAAVNKPAHAKTKSIIKTEREVKVNNRLKKKNTRSFNSIICPSNGIVKLANYQEKR